MPSIHIYHETAPATAYKEPEELVFLKLVEALEEPFISRLKGIVQKHKMLTKVDNAGNMAIGTSFLRATALLSDLKDAQFKLVLSPELFDYFRSQVNKEEFAKKLAASTMAKMEEYSGRTLRQYQRDDISWLFSVDCGIMANQQRLGKFQPLECKVLTPDGWKRMGDMQVGDLVLTPKGEAVHVIGVYPQGIQPVFKVTTSDGAVTECGDDHLWAVQTHDARWRGSGFRVRALKDFKYDLGGKTRKAAHKCYIPTATHIEFDEMDYGIPPYIMGALLGDGGIIQGSITLTNTDEDLLDRVRFELPEFLELVQGITRGVKTITYRLSSRQVGGKFPRTNLFIQDLRILDLWGHGSDTKFIPDRYLFGSRAQRVALLQGLMDTDGYITKDAITSYSSNSSRLIDGFCHLIWSLGGTVRRSWKYSASGKPHHLAWFTLPDDIIPFHTQRKLVRFRPHTVFKATRFIKSVEPAGEKECQCISIDSPEGLYVTDDFIVTHNTCSIAALFKQRGSIAIGPLAAVDVWKKEVELMRKDLRPIVIPNATKFRWPKVGEVIILHYQAIPAVGSVTGAGGKSRPGLVHFADACPPGVTIVYDECQWIKNPKAERTKRSKYLSDIIKKKNGFRWLVTGTPLPNRRAELWDFLCFLHIQKELFPQGRDWFLKADESEDEYIASRLSKRMVRRLRKDVISQLPLITRETVQVPVPEDCGGILDALWAKAIERGVLDEHEDILDLLKLDPDFFLYSKIRGALAKAKIPYMLNWVEEMTAAEEIAVIGSAHKAPVEALGDCPGWGFIHGGVDKRDRLKLVEQFQAGKLIGLGLTIKTGGMAIDLSMAGNMLIVDQDWVPGNNAQLEDRIVAVDKSNPLLYKYLVIDHPLEQHIHRVLSAKQSQIERIDTMGNKCNDPSRSIRENRKILEMTQGDLLND